jgi:hypothetical protein
MLRLRSPLLWILLVVGLVHAIGLGWGLPGSDGWDNDGVAPRDFLPGLAASFTWGRFYTYPPLHLAILAILTLPVTLVALARAPSTALADVVSEMIKVPYMTAMSGIARAVALVMSLAIVVFIARIAEELRARELGIPGPRLRDNARVRRAGYFAAAFAGVNASFAYYSKTSNLDVPQLFWSTWALLTLTRAMTRQEPRLLRRAFALAALAVGTKDQAYALFLLSAPIGLGLWLATDASAREHRSRILRETAIAVAGAALLLAFVDGAIFNPKGFQARVSFLTGSASQDYVEYTSDWSGRVRLLGDIARKFDRQYPFVLAPVVLLGLVRACIGASRRPARPSGWAPALLPLLAAISFTVTFNGTARRTDARFLISQAIVLAVYGGLGLDWIVFAPRRPLRIAGQALMSVAMAKALFMCVSVDANMLADPRYDIEEWLAAHVRPGDTIETYGHNVYMPRLAPLAHVIRVGPEPLDKRNRMDGVEEVQAPFEQADQRGARFIVLPTAWVWRYLVDPELFTRAGRQMAPTQERTAFDKPGVQFFEELVRSQGAFEHVHTAKYDDAVFPVVEVHGTTTRWVYIYERKKR